ncbi:hypothetical protein FIV42_17165 [Persicimonas caeni]|uniref:Sodium:proline symporter n=1 Tax=Persicimonas caeni TaxID=2292766 RepID=A0A4Y6PVR3_PERCE|nr:hypothetical protein [Persicimonas caeni]QDG52408.1 hypothetical protein FIV42_17165 [Persicimonas caeni]QED33630.1 hypothetical protein FRD00_17160 [Persicimonas caeni]
MAQTQQDRPFDWRALVLAGIIAGLVYLIVEMALVPLTGLSAWAPPRMRAAIVMGPEVLTPLEVFDAGVFVLALALHLSLSIVYAALIGLFVRLQSVGMAALIGAGFGLLLYMVNFFVFTGVFPWFAEARSWVTALSHLVFGGVAGAAFVWISRPSEWGRPTVAS